MRSLLLAFVDHAHATPAEFADHAERPDRGRSRFGAVERSFRVGALLIDPLLSSGLAANLGVSVRNPDVAYDVANDTISLVYEGVF
ncbi:MAG: hypothetical protein AAFY46_11035, partial [Planctomycetota bacterium]